MGQLRPTNRTPRMRGRFDWSERRRPAWRAQPEQAGPLATSARLEPGEALAQPAFERSRAEPDAENRAALRESPATGEAALRLEGRAAEPR